MKAIQLLKLSDPIGYTMLTPGGLIVNVHPDSLELAQTRGYKVKSAPRAHGEKEGGGRP